MLHRVHLRTAGTIWMLKLVCRECNKQLLSKLFWLTFPIHSSSWFTFPPFILRPLWHSSETISQFDRHKNNTDKDMFHFSELNWLSRGYKSEPVWGRVGLSRLWQGGSKPSIAAALHSYSYTQTVMVLHCFILLCALVQFKGYFLDNVFHFF